MKILTHPLTGVVFGRPNHNGRIYDRAEFMDAMNRASSNPLMIQFMDHDTFQMEQACGRVVGFDFGDHDVMVHWTPLDTPEGRLISELDDAKVEYSISTVGAGNVGDNGIVTDFDLLYLIIVGDTLFG